MTQHHPRRHAPVAAPGGHAVPSDIEAGCGAHEALRQDGAGSVLGVHAGTVWLRLPGGVVGLAEAGRAPRGPLWVRFSPGPPYARAAVRRGDDVTISAGRVVLAGAAVDLGAARRWSGGLPDPGHLDARAVGIAMAALDGVGRSALAAEPWREALASATARLTGGDLAGAAAVLTGLGPGLTPAGDDILCGVLVARRSCLGPPAEPALLAAVDGLTTTDLSLAFLGWSARGQHIDAVHDLLEAAVAGDAPGARRAAARLGRFGSSSGVDVAHGLRLGLASVTAAG